MSDLTVTILMPCLNEAETLAFCVRQAVAALRDNNVAGEVVVADNGSTDGSQKIATDEGARVVNVPVRGYGAALIAGIEAARGKYILMADADASYHFEHLPRFLPKLDEGYDLVMGNRFSGTIEPGAMPPLHRYLGNPVLSSIGRIFFGIPVRDFHCGLRAFRRDPILALNLRTTGMEFASEMVVKSSLAGLRMTEVPTTLSPDGRSRPPHLRSWRDGWRHLRFLLLFSPRWLFLIPGVVTFFVGIILSLWLIPGPQTVGRWTFDVDTLTYALGLVLIGAHISVFAVSARVFGTQEGFLPPNPKFERIFNYINLEVGLLFGSALLLVGLGILGYAIHIWHGAGFGDLSPQRMLRLTLPSATCFMLGVEAIFGSFFLSLLGMNRR
ncbi:glycosyltransferase family 2 protein [Tunturiibacter gelidoferens]|uniref:Glycosyltransferase involved in cell wall biosynthesis n=1 Tax=Tunturiibacter gelidiferens TaxID=3069689 RepID=A0ACC5P0Z7_9BACT|nr:glycosyltransferase family 2 protein [Edaphobacter lichenicola]MBB5340517.1 glycosyltransferase involved in cell wall biosynthesis [Edaphobacter lichenicola]